jgi:hypothetical protein
LLKLRVKSEQIESAKKRMAAHPDNGLLKTNSNNALNGYVSEEVLRAYLKQFTPTDLTTHSKAAVVNSDFLYKGLKIELKTKQSKYLEIPDSWDCSTWAYLKQHQKPDYYIFTRIYKESNDWILIVVGWISSAEFWDKCVEVKKGSYLANSGSYARDTSYNVLVRDVNPDMRELMTELDSESQKRQTNPAPTTRKFRREA